MELVVFESHSRELTAVGRPLGIAVRARARNQLLHMQVERVDGLRTGRAEIGVALHVNCSALGAFLISPGIFAGSLTSHRWLML